MQLLLVEDETLAADRLAGMLRQRLPAAELLGPFDSVEETVECLRDGARPELAFFDIQLADGLSFSIFDRVEVPCPVIFTTAFDEYALRAFEVNSIDYLLKPIQGEKLDRALGKFRDRGAAGRSAPPTEAILLEALAMLRGKKYKERFVIKSGATLQTVDVADIQYFWSENKLSWLRHADGRKYMVDYKLEQLEDILDPTTFFRVNRKYVVGLPAIIKATVYSNSRLKLHLPYLDAGEEVVVSREKVTAFKSWLRGEH